VHPTAEWAETAIQVLVGGGQGPGEGTHLGLGSRERPLLRVRTLQDSPQLVKAMRHREARQRAWGAVPDIRTGSARKVAVAQTSSQGPPMGSLVEMAGRDHRRVEAGLGCRGLWSRPWEGVVAAEGAARQHGPSEKKQLL